MSMSPWQQKHNYSQPSSLPPIMSDKRRGSLPSSFGRESREKLAACHALFVHSVATDRPMLSSSALHEKSRCACVFVHYDSIKPATVLR